MNPSPENGNPAFDEKFALQAPRPGALEQEIRDLMRKKQYSLRTEESYIGWYRRYVKFHDRRHPREMGALEAGAFLTHLAVNRGVAAATQNQALNALVFLYREVLGIDLEGIQMERSRRAPRLPNVLAREEVAVLLGATAGEAGLMCRLLYGCGLRVSEALRLRVKDMDLAGGKLEVRAGKGDKDRVLTLPRVLMEPLSEQRARAEQLYQTDRKAGLPGVALPHALEAKSPGAGTSWPWFWFFPSRSLSVDPRSGLQRRHHVHEIGISRELARAAERATLGRRVTAHTLRHSFATHLVLRGVDIRSVQELMGHANVATTEIYTRLARAMRGEIGSPLDDLT